MQLSETAHLINQSHQTLDYHPEYWYNQQQSLNSQMRQNMNLSKSRPTPYQAPSRNQFSDQNFNQQNIAYSTHRPNLNFSQPLVPFNTLFQPNYHDFPPLINHQNNAIIQHQQNQFEQIQTIDQCYNISLQNEPNPTISTENTQHQKSYTIKFKSNKNFPEIYNDYFHLEEYLNKIKPENKITTAFINSDELIIKFKDENQLDYLKSWPNEAFGHGITEVIKEKKHYLALHNVNLNFDMNAEKAKKYLKDNYSIDDTLRMVKKSTNEKLTLVKAVMSNTNKFNQIIKDGYINIGQFSRIRVTPWRFGINPEQCFKCLKFGHKQDKCQEKEETCLRCGKKNHNYKQCKITDQSKFKCINCGGNHAAVSKSCPVLNEAVKNKTKELEDSVLRKKGNSNFVRHESSFQKTQYPPNLTTNLLKFIIDLIKNLNEIRNCVYGDPQPLLKIIDQNFGVGYSNLIHQHVFSNQINKENDPYMTNPYIENEIEQN
ncbi:unnamed protein product [Brachionus calyciflorus]|uniref:CCHC-type domain-containing protein n=1 Tax=Brachionus calyciflorus TaxID=104777 RepID=A0A814M6M8_9BILA|nr:unnamed protein product [Brachionus calyciflorus]